MQLTGPAKSCAAVSIVEGVRKNSSIATRVWLVLIVGYRAVNY
jgi:hypothetical protein